MIPDNRFRKLEFQIIVLAMTMAAFLVLLVVAGVLVFHGRYLYCLMFLILSVLPLQVSIVARYRISDLLDEHLSEQQRTPVMKSSA